VRILILDIENMSLSFALRCAAAGDEVRLHRYSPKKPVRYGDGFKEFKIVETWKDSLPWVGKDGLIVCSGNYVLLYELDRLREFGYRIFAPTVKSAALEIDRMAGLKAMEAVGIPVPEYHVFATMEDAEKFAMKADEPFVFKPAGDEENKALTYVADDPADLVGWLRRQRASGKQMKGKCLLQKKIEMLSEMGVSGWCGPDGFLPDKWQNCWEHKKLMSGEIGCNTGEQGTLTQYTETEKLATDMLLPMQPILQALGHRGDFAIGCGIDTSGKPWGFEFTARLGYPAWFIQMSSHKGSPSKWMRDLLDGKDSLRVSYDVAIGVVVGIPRYPYGASPPELVEGHPIHGYEDVKADIHLASAMMGKGPVMRDGKIVDEPIVQTAGEYVMVATGLGKTIERARRKVYGTLDKVRVADMIYRDDIGEKLADPLPALHRYGYAVDLDYG
jgi:phosphoribosylamine--glycine ligase